MKEYKKICTICKKEFLAKRNHADTCGDACRSQKNAKIRALKLIAPIVKKEIEKAKPAIVAEAKAEEREEVFGKVSKFFDRPVELCAWCNEYNYKDNTYMVRPRGGILNVFHLCNKHKGTDIQEQIELKIIRAHNELFSRGKPGGSMRKNLLDEKTGEFIGDPFNKKIK